MGKHSASKTTKMAASTAMLRNIGKKSQNVLSNLTKINSINIANQSRNIVTKESGAVLPKPQQVSMGLVKVTLTVTPFLYTGAQISQHFAAWLEENELFVPDDDDDD